MAISPKLALVQQQGGNIKSVTRYRNVSSIASTTSARLNEGKLNARLVKVD